MREAIPQAFHKSVEPRKHGPGSPPPNPLYHPSVHDINTDMHVERTRQPAVSRRSTVMLHTIILLNHGYFGVVRALP